MVLGCGTDLIETERIHHAVAKWNNAFLQRVFTEREIAYSMKRRYYEEHLAARFAAKEAVLKAFGSGFSAANLKDVEIVNDDNGRPQVILRGPMRALQTKRGIGTITVSMTHTRRYAHAVALLLGRTEPCV